MTDRADRDTAPPERAGPVQPRSAHDFDVMYTTTPPWDIGRPQPAFVELADAGAVRGRVLDVGCGTGEHALMAAGLGLDATGIDLAAAAIEQAREKAHARGLSARFLRHDVLELPALGETFDTVLDCGLFHVLEDPNRVRFVDGLRQVVAPGGRYFMLCFSDQQPGDWGPRRITQDEIRASFADGWNIEAIEAATLDVNLDPGHALAWRSTITRR